jgi:branched-chain amino acid transport system permease protein
MSTTERTQAAATGSGYRVRRSSLTSWLGSLGFLVILVVLAFVPIAFVPVVIQQTTSFLILVILASMWNALAGYGGLVSVGQQAYIGFGAYAVIFLTQRDVEPYLSIVIAALASASSRWSSRRCCCGCAAASSPSPPGSSPRRSG